MRQHENTRCESGLLLLFGELTAGTASYGGGHSSYFYSLYFDVNNFTETFANFHRTILFEIFICDDPDIEKLFHSDVFGKYFEAFKKLLYQ